MGEDFVTSRREATTAATKLGGLVSFVSGLQRHIEDTGERRLATGYPGATARRIGLGR